MTELGKINHMERHSRKRLLKKVVICSAILLAIIVVVGVFLFVSGYRLSGLQAAKAHFAVSKEAEPFEEIDLEWGKVYLLKTSDKGNRTTCSGFAFCDQTGFLWRCTYASWGDTHSEDGIITLASAGWEHREDEQITIFSVQASDPRVVYVEAGSGADRVKQAVLCNVPVVFRWSYTGISVDRLSAKALDADGHVLYEYRYRYTNITNDEDLRWYPADEQPQITSITSDQSSATVTLANGLSLTLSLSSTTCQSGEQISVSIDEKNTLATKNNIPVANGWPVQGLGLGPGPNCGTLDYPFGISILQGYYDDKSVTSITPLQLSDPNVDYFCPVILAKTSYEFQPSSDIATIYDSYGSEPYSKSMSIEIISAGFWTGSRPKATYTSFTPGVYTVVGGDEWGALVVLHFVVS